MLRYGYNDGRQPGGRTPRLYLVKDDRALKFAGENIPGYCAVVTAQFEKNGKWSNTDYVLDLCQGVRALEFISPLHGTWGDDLGSWTEVAAHLAVSIETAQAIIRSEYPKTSDRLDALDAFALAAESQGRDTEVVVLTFPGRGREFTRHGVTSTGRTVTVQADPSDYGPQWDGGRCKAIAPEGAMVLDASKRPGFGGGTWTVRVAVPTGGGV